MQLDIFPDEPIYALVCLNQDTEEQLRECSNDYATLCAVRNLRRTLGWQANIFFAEYAGCWDALLYHIPGLTVADIQAVTQ